MGFLGCSSLKHKVIKISRSRSEINRENKKRGGNFERSCIKHLQNKGFWTIKAYGSKGAADITAIKAITVDKMDLSVVHFIQCKKHKKYSPLSKKEIDGLNQRVRLAGGCALVMYKDHKANKIMIAEMGEFNANCEDINKGVKLPDYTL